MLFNSYEFLLLFLPAVLLAHYALQRTGSRALVVGAIVVASLVFYASWRWQLSWAVGASLVFNLAWSRWIATAERAAVRRALLWSGVAANVAWLAGFKIAAWPDCDSWWYCPGGFRSARDILIPLGISFITFQQIIFLVDTAKSRVERPSALEYLFMVLFFPHLVMGPLVHARNMLPQIRARAFMTPNAGNLAIGAAIFAVGLFKKTVLADSLGAHVDSVYDRVAAGAATTTLDAWAAALAFPIQLYFDFSGYADMAVGLARMLGIVIPFGFLSPLKAADRFELWRRWNVTVTEFFRTYVFMPLCRRGVPHVLALLVTALLSGLWHGIGPTFVMWAVALTLLMLGGHAVKQVPALNYAPASGRTIYRAAQIALTFLVTVVLSVTFRSPDVDTARHLYLALIGSGVRGDVLVDARYALLMATSAAIVWGLPNTREIFGAHATATAARAPRIAFRYGWTWALAVAAIAVGSVAMIERSGRFVYMQF
jgi:alginate O-acetyltransferase complex protein AlgI